MNREQGMSSLALVLLLLILGSMMLAGLNQQLDALARILTAERKAIQHQAVAQSALEWGRTLAWQTQADYTCQQHAQQPWRVCLRLMDGRALLIASSDSITLWRQGEVAADRVLFSPHGWSDFCPLKERALCQ
ncbi:DUF2509 family protein [Leclercia adecarboxylata]|uniref:DUF2509 family protein n=1 Tax=Leclercia adecarboxylata TaxID=83655 RepID=UPI002DBC6143|nr:DUF2509 family protein [Leclercia adecarboxylata]MEB6380257.1 DUF2509 family protein [Leclercia adecarboxylata]